MKPTNKEMSGYYMTQVITAGLSMRQLLWWHNKGMWVVDDGTVFPENRVQAIFNGPFILVPDAPLPIEQRIANLEARLAELGSAKDPTGDAVEKAITALRRWYEIEMTRSPMASTPARDDLLHAAKELFK